VPPKGKKLKNQREKRPRKEEEESRTKEERKTAGVKRSFI